MRLVPHHVRLDHGILHVFPADLSNAMFRTPQPSLQAESRPTLQLAFLRLQATHYFV